MLVIEDHLHLHSFLDSVDDAIGLNLILIQVENQETFLAVVVVVTENNKWCPQRRSVNFRCVRTVMRIGNLVEKSNYYLYWYQV